VKAADLAREVLDREQAELRAGRGTASDVAEAQQRLEQFNLDVVTRTSDVFTTERRLRDLLGLPPADNRRILPTTPPIEVRLEPDWEKCLAVMLDQQPDIGWPVSPSERPRSGPARRS
jgi:outer membrane protein TolC